MGSARHERCYVDREPGQGGEGEHVARLQDLRLAVPTTLEAIDLDPVRVAVDDPLLGDTEADVEIPLPDAIHPGI